MAAQNMQLDMELEDINPERFDKKLVKTVNQTHYFSKTIDDFLKPNKKPNTIKLSETIKAALDIIGKSLEHNNITLYKSFVNDVEITTYSSEMIINKHLQGTIEAKNIDGGASFCICIPIKLSYES